MTDFSIILRSLRARLFSTVTTVLTVAIAVGLMLVLLSMRNAGQQAFQRGTGNMHLLVSRDQSPLVAILNGIFYANPPQRPITWQKYQQIANGFPLEWAIPTQQGDSYNGLPVLATVPEFFTKFHPNEGEPWALASGRFLRNAGDPLPSGEGANAKPDSHAYEIVLGSQAAKSTGLKLGDEIHLTHGIAQSRQLGEESDHAPHVHEEFNFRIVGILKPTGSAHDRALFTHIDGGWVLHAHDRRVHDNPKIKSTTLADITENDRLITGIYARVITRPGQRMSASQQTVFDQLRRDATITVADPVQQVNALFRIVSNIDTIFIALAAAVLLSSGIGIMLALYNSMHERRRQIAVLRVLGCSQARIFSLILTEAAIIGAAGAVLGLGFAVIGTFAAAGVLKTQIGLAISPSFEPVMTLMVMVGAVLLGAAAGIIPALLAYRTSVANNLKPMG